MPATGDSDRADLTTPCFFSGMGGDDDDYQPSEIAGDKT
jgi:hypothetical protein